MRMLFLTLLAIFTLSTASNLQALSIRDIVKPERVDPEFTSLNLARKGLTEFTEEDGLFLARYFPNLEKLQLAGNQLTSLPKSIGALTSLQLLILEKNRFECIPQALQYCAQSLNRLYLNENPIQRLPSWMDGYAKPYLASLLEICLFDHQLSEQQIQVIKRTLPWVYINSIR